MTDLEAKVRQARSRLTTNRWLNQVCVTVTVASGVFAAVVLAARAYGWQWPLGAIALGLGGVALAVSIIWAAMTRVDLARAAVSLDEAAGLRERLSSGLYCRRSDDPFERAVLADAENTGANLTVGRHLRLQVPRRMGATAIAVVIAAAMLLLPSGMLVRADADQKADSLAAERTAAVIKTRTERIKRIAKTNPELKTLADELDKLGQAPDERLRNPSDLRQSALKKLDRMQDVLKQQKGRNKFANAKQFKKMLRALKTPKPPDTPTSKLAKALASGDFKAAREQIKTMQERLAKLSTPQDAQKLKDMQRQLEELAKKLEMLAGDKKLVEKLQQAGLKKEDIERMLKQLSEKDIDQLKKQLEKQGMSQEEIDKLTKQLQKRQGANSLARQLGQALQNAARSAGSGSTGPAMDQLASAADQLSDLEMLEQEMNQIDSMIADVQEAKNDLGNPCSQCNGTGMLANGRCPGCQGSGNGMGRMGRGRGGIAREEQTRVSFVKKRGKVHTGRGAIIGQYLIDGQQIKGDVSADLSEVVTAAERDATDAITRARIPRRYHKAVKEYFSDLQKQLDKGTNKQKERKDESSERQ